MEEGPRGGEGGVCAHSFLDAMQLVLAEDMQLIEDNTSFQEVYTYKAHLTLCKL
jgi:hypothetical protein